LILGGLGLLVARRMVRVMLHFPRFGGFLALIGVILIVVALLDFVLAWGLWTGKGWAWILTLIFAVLGIVFSLVSMIRGGLVAILILALDIIIVFYLFTPRVKAFFGETKAPVSPPTPPLTVILQTPPTASTGNRFCSNCGAPVTSVEQFCAHCGTKLV